MGVLDEAKLPLGYSTEYPPVFGQCDNCHESLNNQDQYQVLICGHGYHVNCYALLEFRCHHCLEYLKKGIQQNVDSFLSRLNSGMEKLVEDDIEEVTETQDDENDELININNNEIENVQISLNERLQKLNTW